MTTGAPRRTRAQQRDATRAALLDATIESLIADGYIRTTTRGVAARAGVSQGAQQHYFPTKPALVEAALVRWFEQFASVEIPALPAATSARHPIAPLLDTFWLVHNQPIATAIIEILGIARTDPEHATGAARAANQLHQLALDLARTSAPEIATVPGFQGWLYTALAAIRGAVLTAALPDADPAISNWPTMREHLLHSLDALLDKTPQHHH